MGPSIGQDCRRANALRHRRLNIQVKLSDKAGHCQPRIALDRYTGVGADAALSSRYRQPLILQLGARLLCLIPSLTCKLEKPQVVLLEDISLDCHFPPLPSRRRQVGRRLRRRIGDDFHGKSLRPVFKQGQHAVT
jgi:hypothetical protein